MGRSGDFAGQAENMQKGAAQLLLFIFRATICRFMIYRLAIFRPAHCRAVYRKTQREKAVH